MAEPGVACSGSSGGVTTTLIRQSQTAQAERLAARTLGMLDSRWPSEVQFRDVKQNLVGAESPKVITGAGLSGHWRVVYLVRLLGQS